MSGSKSSFEGGESTGLRRYKVLSKQFIDGQFTVIGRSKLLLLSGAFQVVRRSKNGCCTHYFIGMHKKSVGYSGMLVIFSYLCFLRK